MKLNYREDGTFKIIQFTDTHFGERPYNEEDEKTFAGIDKVIEQLDADLIVHTGDVAWSEAPNPQDNFEVVMKHFDKHKVPFVVTFGNHDAEVEGITRSELRAIYETQVNSKATKSHVMVVDDRENFVLELYSADNNKVESVAYVIDSGDYPKIEVGTYAWVHPEQVAWFRETSKKYRRGDGIQRNLVFQHIAVPEYWEASEDIIAGEALEEPELVCSPKINTGLFSEMVMDGETWGMFVGHDHDNTYHGKHMGQNLVFGNVSGYNTYGELPRGVRVIELNANDQTVKTYTVAYDELA